MPSQPVRLYQGEGWMLVCKKLIEAKDGPIITMHFTAALLFLLVDCQCVVCSCRCTVSVLCVLAGGLSVCCVFLPVYCQCVVCSCWCTVCVLCVLAGVLSVCCVFLLVYCLCVVCSCWCTVSVLRHSQSRSRLRAAVQCP